MRLPCRCLAMTTSTGSTIPAFIHHVTTFFVLLFMSVRNPTDRLLNLISLSAHPSLCITQFEKRSTEFVWNLIPRSINNIYSQIQFRVKIEQRQRTLWRSRPTYISVRISLHTYHSEKCFECPVRLPANLMGLEKINKRDHIHKLLNLWGIFKNHPWSSEHIRRLQTSVNLESNYY